MGYMIIYQLTNKRNGKIYIGQTIGTLENRLRGHLNPRRNTSAIHRALTKYGAQAFKKDILVYCQNKDEANHYEKLLVEKLNTRTPYGYNITVGGESRMGMTHTPEAIEKIRAASTGRLHSKEAKQKIREAHIGVRHTPEVLERISAKLKGREGTFKGHTHSDEAKQKISENGKKLAHTDEVKQNIAEASKKMWETRLRTVPFKERPSAKGRTPWNKGQSGFTHTEEARLKISQASKGRIISDATRQKMREAATLRERKKKQNQEIQICLT